MSDKYVSNDMNDDQILLLTIAEVLLEVNLSEEKKERIRSAMCGVYVPPDEPKKSQKFIVPSVEDVTTHMADLTVLNPQKHAEEFWHFYNSKGWFVGKNKMKSWKSAASRWVINLPKGGSDKKKIIV